MTTNSIFERQLGASLALRLVLGLTLALALLAAGCGKKDQGIESDPVDLGGMNDGRNEETVDLPEDPFADTGANPDDVGGITDPPDQTHEIMVLSDVFFEFNQYDLSADGRAALSNNARLLRQSPDTRILIEGHCDERGTIQYNLALGERRARAAKQYLVDLGIERSRIDIISYGKEKPFELGHNEASWAKNRRAHFTVRGGR